MRYRNVYPVSQVLLYDGVVYLSSFWDIARTAKHGSLTVKFQRWGIFAGTWLCFVVLIGGCGDLRMLRYRDDAFLQSYHYTLGEKYITVDGLRMCYQEFGEGPNVLILPGLGTSIDFWQRNVPALAEHFHVVAVDLPGFGKSDKPDADYELSWIGDRILAFMDAMKMERASLIGGSMGGHLGLLLALDYPDRVDKLVMMGSTGAWPPPSSIMDLGIKLLWNEWLVRNYMQEHWMEIYPMMFKHESELTQRLFHYQMALRAASGQYAPEGQASARALRSIFYHTCRHRLSELRAPLLLIWGEEDAIHPTEDGLYIRMHTPDSRLVMVSNSGHEVMIDQTDVFNRVVGDFLQFGTSAVEDHFDETSVESSNDSLLP